MAQLSQRYTSLGWCRNTVLGAWCLLPVIKASDLDGFNKRTFSCTVPSIVTALAQVVN